MTALRVARCCDCSLVVIGDRMRCPACHDAHARRIAIADLVVEVRRAELRSRSWWQRLLAWARGRR